MSPEYLGPHQIEVMGLGDKGEGIVSEPVAQAIVLQMLHSHTGDNGPFLLIIGENASDFARALTRLPEPLDERRRFAWLDSEERS